MPIFSIELQALWKKKEMPLSCSLLLPCSLGIQCLDYRNLWVNEGWATFVYLTSKLSVVTSDVVTSIAKCHHIFLIVKSNCFSSSLTPWPVCSFPHAHDLCGFRAHPLFAPCFLLSMIIFLCWNTCFTSIQSCLTHSLVLNFPPNRSHISSWQLELFISVNQQHHKLNFPKGKKKKKRELLLNIDKIETRNPRWFFISAIIVPRVPQIENLRVTLSCYTQFLSPTPKEGISYPPVPWELTSRAPLPRVPKSANTHISYITYNICAHSPHILL